VTNIFSLMNQMNNISDSLSAGPLFVSGKNPVVKTGIIFFVHYQSPQAILAKDFNALSYSSISLSTNHSALLDHSPVINQIMCLTK